MASAGHSKLFVWLSPSFPVASFAYSHGLEWAQKAELVTGEASLQSWLSDLLTHGSWHNDAIFLVATFDRLLATSRHDLRSVWPDICGIIDLNLALCASKERYSEMVQQGNALVLAAKSAWSCDTIDLVDRDISYPVALALLCIGHHIEKRDVLAAYGLSFVQNLVSASIRLGIIGQTSGQNIIAALLPIVEREVENLASSTLDDLSNAALTSDFASIQHETQYTRIFRS